MAEELVGPQNGKTGLRRIWNALFYSAAGIRSAWRHEAAFRQEVVLALVLIPLALFMPVASGLKAMMIASVLFVLVVELLNSAIETVVDRISLDQDPLSKRAKDISSAAVLISLINVLVVWVLALLA